MNWLSMAVCHRGASLASPFTIYSLCDTHLNKFSLSISLCPSASHLCLADFQAKRVGEQLRTCISDACLHACRTYAYR